MTIDQIANLMSLPIGIICLFISLRAFYFYSLSYNDMVYVLAFSMASIATGTLFGAFGASHLFGNQLNTEWGRAYGSCSGGLFIFLSSLVRSHSQMQKLRRWQIGAAILLVFVFLLTPFYPPTTNPIVEISLNSCRMIIYSSAFIRYAIIYASRSTRFSLIMSMAFLVLVFGFALNIPGAIGTNFAILTIVAASIRIIAYLTLMVAYTTN
jgi:hypothetical protein